MNLIDRYVNEVGRHLPRKNRSDIQAELRSLLMDALEDRAGLEPTEPEIVECVRLTRLSSAAFGLSVKRHNGRWERTPFSGRLEDMVRAIHEFMQHLVTPR